VRARIVSAVLALLGITLGAPHPGGAHDAVSALAEWGDFGAAAPCQRALGAAVERCIDAALAVRSACADGAPCDEAAIVAARQAALDAIERACRPSDAGALSRTDLARLEVDAVRACRSVTDRLVDAWRAGGNAAPAMPCARARATAAARLGRFAVRAWRRAFDHIASLPMTPPAKEALAARAARRIDRVAAVLAARLGAACDAPADPAAGRVLAAAALAARCFAGDVYAQPAVTCAPVAAESQVAQAACVNGSAAGYPCRNVELAAFLPLSAIGGGSSNDVWGWTDPLTGREYALLGRSSGVSFVDVSTPTAPVYLGNLPTHTVNSTWRGIKVHADHAFIGSEAGGHGLQVFDLRQLRAVSVPPVTFAETAWYGGFGNSHTLAVNTDTGFLYAAGTNTCGGGLHMLDVRTPAAPVSAGCVAGDGYTHEAQCVSYHGPDAAYAGHEICFSSNADTLTITDVTTKSAPAQVSRTTYAGRGYTHQGWLTEDHRYFLLDDETDEQHFGHNTRTYVWDVADLNAPGVIGSYEGPVAAIDHNLYIRGGYAFEANYRSGLRILDLARVGQAMLSEVGFFDVWPADDLPAFNGAWSNYPFFASGTVLVSGIEQGLFVLRPALAAVNDTPTATPTPTPLPSSTPTPVVGAPTIQAPSAGQQLVVSGVTVQWTAVPGATGYDLRIVDAGNTTVFSGSLAGNAATSTIVSLPQNGTYTLRVRACIGDQFSDAACGQFASRAFSLALAAPAAAPTVAAPANGALLGASIQTLRWTAVAGGLGLPVFYEAQLVDRDTGAVELSVTVPDPTLELVTALRSGLFRLRVRACQVACGPWSAPVDFAAQIPAVPTMAPIITTAAVTGGNRADVAWTAVAGAEWYQLFVVQPPPAGPGGGALTVAARQVFGSSVAALPVPAGDGGVVVAACSGNGCGPFSGPAPLMPAGPNPALPLLGQPLAGSVVDGPVVLFTWSRVPDDDGGNTTYRLYVQDLSRQAGALDVLTTQNFAAGYFKAEGARYDALVIANPGTPRERVGPAVGFVVRGSSPNAPTLVAPTHNGSVAAGNVQLAWSPLPGATLYEYYVSVPGAPQGSARGVSPGLFVQVPLAALDGQPTLYSAIVRACPAGQTCTSSSDAGWGPWSATAGTGVTNFTVLPPPVPPGGSSLRFFGTGSGDVDRVKISLDAPARPVDVGGFFTIEWWMRTAPGNTSGACTPGGDGWINGNILVDRDVFGAGDAGDYGVSLFGNGGRLAFGVAVGGSGNTICGTRNVADGAWHHVAVTRDADTGELRLYVDGQLDASGSGPLGDVAYRDGRTTSYPNSDPFLVLGAEKHDAGVAYPSYHGWLDELRVSNVVRYGGPFAVPTQPFGPDAATRALYHFDEGNGTLISDRSGAPGGPSDGRRRVGGAAQGPQWSTDTPFATAAPAISLQPVATGLSAPTSITHAGDARLFITEQGGAIRIWDGTQLLPTPFLTIGPLACCDEQGLLGIAFHPDYATNGYFFVDYTNPAGDTVIARYRRSAADPNLADPASGVVLLTIPQPAANHNGGQLQFGPDGYLYIGMGDGGGGCDDAGPCNGQRTDTLLGKILRIDVNQNIATPPYYGIPPSNPFVGPGDPPDEVWASGVRNPWRFAFDRLTGGLFIADVGQGAREEVDYQPAESPGGENYGWKVMEGSLCGTCALSGCPATPACNSPALSLPILEYAHTGGNCSITGGYAYRGTRVPYLYGRYLFGDLCSGRLWWAAQNNGAWTSTAFGATAGGLYTFGEAADGELYVGRGNGTLSRIQ
jgi:choice-of-anchor B domain-containing protein